MQSVCDSPVDIHAATEAPAEAEDDLRFMQRAARLAWRGHGLVEPNPMVGCVLVSPGGRIVGEGYHRRFGGPHAEINALGDAGLAARGATCYVTLEPCNHRGKTGPCAEALIGAGVRRVVIARPDPHPEASGGAARLREAGIAADFTNACPEALAATDPFVHRVRTGLPWVIAKWAQTVDGRIATRTGESKWISSESSRLLVHRKRAKVDAILTGIGTVLADDPLLTARGVRIRRIARRVIVDPELNMPLDSAIVRTAGDTPTTVACAAAGGEEKRDVIMRLRDAGVDVLLVGECEAASECLPLASILRHLIESHGTTNVLVEAGPGLMSRLFNERLVCELWTFISPQLFGDDRALPPLRGRDVPTLARGIALHLVDHRLRDGNLLLRYRVQDEHLV